MHGDPPEVSQQICAGAITGKSQVWDCAHEQGLALAAPAQCSMKRGEPPDSRMPLIRAFSGKVESGFPSENAINA
jgi:hypothetical protein